jgi:hypothetical protein
MTTLNETASWIIYNKLTGKAVFETFEENTARAFSQFNGVYQVMPILEWLQNLNKPIGN